MVFVAHQVYADELEIHGVELETLEARAHLTHPVMRQAPRIAVVPVVEHEDTVHEAGEPFEPQSVTGARLQCHDEAPHLIRMEPAPAASA
jgi:hypothetical protein